MLNLVLHELLLFMNNVCFQWTKFQIPRWALKETGILYKIVFMPTLLWDLYL